MLSNRNNAMNIQPKKFKARHGRLASQRGKADEI